MKVRKRSRKNTNCYSSGQIRQAVGIQKKMMGGWKHLPFFTIAKHPVERSGRLFHLVMRGRDDRTYERTS
jgi:hypothetical protein